MFVVRHPSKILKQRCTEVDDFSQVKSVIDQMSELMFESHGVGLAAPQVGILKRFILIDQTSGNIASCLRLMINPIIESFSDEKVLDVEGCLSIPGTKLVIPRSQCVSVKYFDIDGNRVSVSLNGLEARIAQHEIDHIDGITMLDRVIRK